MLRGSLSNNGGLLPGGGRGGGGGVSNEVTGASRISRTKLIFILIVLIVAVVITFDFLFLSRDRQTTTVNLSNFVAVPPPFAYHPKLPDIGGRNDDSPELTLSAVDAPLLLLIHHGCYIGCIDNGTHYIQPKFLEIFNNKDTNKDTNKGNIGDNDNQSSLTNSTSNATSSDFLSSSSSSSSPSSPSSSHSFENHLESQMKEFFGGSLSLWSNPCLAQTKRANRETRWGLWGAILAGEPIDIVYTWVNGSDPEHIAQRAQFGGSNPNVKQLQQFVSHDELKYSLRSVSTYAPWVRKIFLVVGGPTQVPNFVNISHPQLEIVFHSDLYNRANASHHLPTFNSNSIETHLHRIPGLSDHYIYLNDDVFFGDHICVEDFYTPRGGYKVFIETDAALSPTHANFNLNSAWKSAWNGHQLLNGQFGKRSRHLITHTPQMYNKHIVEHIQRKFWKEFWTTSSNRFRAESDLGTAFLYYHYLDEATDVIFKAAKSSASLAADEYMYMKLADIDGDGIVSQRELRELLWTLSLSFSIEQIEKMTSEVFGSDLVLPPPSSNMTSTEIAEALTSQTQPSQKTGGVTYAMFSRSQDALGHFKRKVANWQPRMFKTESVIPDLSFEMLSSAGAEGSLQGLMTKRPKFFCLNDVFSNGVVARGGIPPEKVHGFMNKFYDAYYPDKSPLEIGGYKQTPS